MSLSEDNKRVNIMAMLKRYVIQSRSRVPLETPQEMFLGIALHLAMNEGSDRMGWVKRFYDMLSRARAISSRARVSRWRILSAESVPRFTSRRSSSDQEGGARKMRTASGRLA